MHRLNLRKTIQAMGLLLQLERVPRMNYMRAIKMLYLIDREMLFRFGRRLSRDRVVAMERGPVLSTVLDLINHLDVRSRHWEKHFRRDGYAIEMVKPPHLGSLSRQEIQVIKDMAAKHVEHDEWDLVNIVHELPEYKKHEPNSGSCKDIPLVDILKALDKSPEVAAAIAAEEEDDAAFDELLAGVAS